MNEIDPMEIGRLIHEAAEKREIIVITGGGALVFDIKDLDRRFIATEGMIIIDEMTKLDFEGLEKWIGLHDKIEVPHIDEPKVYEELHPPRRSKGDRKRNRRYRWCD